MAGEECVLEVSFDCPSLVGTTNLFTPNTIAVLDSANSSALITAAKPAPATASQQPIGVIYDRARVDMNGNVVTTAMNVRVMGIARVVASAAIAVGAMVGTSAATAGYGAAQAQVGAGVVAKPVLGMALNAAQAAGDEVIVLLTPGVQF